MPERWEHEVRKLRELRPREDLEEQVARGPGRDLTPPTRQRVIAAVTALALFAAAGVFVVRAFGTGSDSRDQVGDTRDESPVAPGELVLEIRAEDGAPAATLRYGELEQRGVVEGYTWCIGEECTSMIADFVFYPPVSEFLVVPPGTPIRVTGDGGVDQLRILDREGDVLDRGVIEAVPTADGQYVLGVGATWSEGEQTGDASIFFGVQALSSPEAAPDVLEVDCGYGATRTDSAVVQTQPDGVHFRFVGTDGFVEYEIFEEHSTSGMGGSFDEGDGPQRMPVPPGRWEVGCATEERPVDEDNAVSFEVVDPADHSAPHFACPAVDAPALATDIRTDVPPADAATQLLRGVQTGDRLREGGYGQASVSRFPYIPYVVDRGGVAVAELILHADGARWSAMFVSCPESGIELADSVVIVPGEVPDVLILRCEGPGPAVDTDVVRLQADGFHVEATNLEHASAVIGIHVDEAAETLIVPFEEAAESIVWEIPPGSLQIGCRVEGQVTGAEPVDHLIEIEVLPAEG